MYIKLNQNENSDNLLIEKNNYNMFIEKFTKEINKLRGSPLSYVDVIKSHKQHVKFKYNDDKIFPVYCNSNPKIILNEGESIFDDCINKLSKIRKMKELKICEDIVIKVPENDSNNPEVIGKLIMEKNKEIGGKYFDLCFHYDICNLNPELSAVMQIVDDTGSDFKRRKNIINNYYDLIGVSVGRLTQKDCFMIYVTFAKSQKVYN